MFPTLEKLSLLLVLLYHKLLLVLTLAMAVVLVLDRMEVTASFAPTHRNILSLRSLYTTNTSRASD